ncbi:hypothetical protein C7N43_34120 [Sphingobacteriales bacterium UPWRP_1]|nr:hypothetical protein BVG80_00855 [Sphingobacteriales bacterium TSM_CSM]PSJ72455.1 hypothetical protein C7N43_34120 [Sphingobacteriales bacterium UPWRP_1]
MHHITDNNRYMRQTALPQIGEQGQQKIQAASVLVVGAGGLGCPALLYLAAAGVGHIGIADADTIALNNLNRQTLFTPADVGKPKAATAALKLQQFNPNLQYTVYNQYLTNQNALQILPLFDVVIDGSDNLPTRYMLSDACQLLQKPLVYGAVYRFEGQVAVFNLPQANGGNSISYRNLFPYPPDAQNAPDCAVSGILGVLPGITGTMQAAEALKIITGLSNPLTGKLLTFNLLEQMWFTTSIPVQLNLQTNAPITPEAFMQFDYPAFCRQTALVHPVAEITPALFAQMLQQPNTLFIDVRNETELPRVTAFTHLQIPLSQLPQALPPISDAQTQLVFFCQTGARSLLAAQIAAKTRPEICVFSLKNGIAGCPQLF